MRAHLAVATFIAILTSGCSTGQSSAEPNNVYEPIPSPSTIAIRPQTPTPSSTSALIYPARSCLTFESSHLEICTAYVINASLASRYAFYQASRSPNAAIAATARRRLSSRYSGSAYDYIHSQTTNWPDSITVQLPIIHVGTVTVAPDDSTATLTTHETWRVVDTNGKSLLEEKNQPRTVKLQQQPGIISQKWVVTNIQ